MEVIRDLDWCPPFDRGSVVTFGEFDGVHRGHRVVLLETMRAAVVEGCPAVVVTFDPRSFPGGDDAPPMLTDFQQKLELFEAADVDVVIELPADRRGSAPDDEPGVGWIIDDVLADTLHARAVVVGEDHHFGSRRRHTMERVRRRADEVGFRIVQIPVDSRRTSNGEVVSARSIREQLAAGEVAAAAAMLGRPHEIRSTVTAGDRRGRTIGFPTVNLPTPQHLQIPAEGVYAGRYLRPNGQTLRAAINIGRRPTFLDGAEPLIEAHLLDFRGDLYGEPARLQFVSRIRGEQRFDGIDALRAQLASDVEEVRRRVRL